MLIFKRIFDITISSIALFILSPILFVLAILVWGSMGSPILFSQQRPGLRGKPFHILKFRTMLNSNDKKGDQLSDAKRLTSFGRFLRSTSLDELPELWNVLKGEMSLVGPRPLLMEYLELYSPKQAQRQDVRPGITGWAQINGRNAISWDEKFILDVWYVGNQSLWLDVKILLLTLWKIVNRENINQAGQATMELFTGSKET